MVNLNIASISTALFRVLALCAIYYTAQIGALFSVVAIILFEVTSNNKNHIQWLESVAIGLSVAIAYVDPAHSGHFYIGVLSSFTFIRLLSHKDISDIALVSSLISLVGINLMAFGFIAPELFNSPYLTYPLLLVGVIACQTQARLLIIGCLLAIGWNSGFDSQLLQLILMISFLIELLSLNNDKALNMAALVGVVLSPLHAWSTIAILLLSLSSLEIINRRAIQIVAAIGAMFACLAATESIYISSLVVFALIIMAIKHNKQGALYVRS